MQLFRLFLKLFEIGLLRKTARRYRRGAWVGHDNLLWITARCPRDGLKEDGLNVLETSLVDGLSPARGNGGVRYASFSIPLAVPKSLFGCDGDWESRKQGWILDYRAMRVSRLIRAGFNPCRDGDCNSGFAQLRFVPDSLTGLRGLISARRSAVFQHADSSPRLVGLAASRIGEKRQQPHPERQALQLRRGM